MLSRKTLLGAGAALFAFAAFPGSTAALDANFKQVVRSESDKRAAYGAAKAILDMLTVIGIFTPDTSVNAWVTTSRYLIRYDNAVTNARPRISPRFPTCARSSCVLRMGIAAMPLSTVKKVAI